MEAEAFMKRSPWLGGWLFSCCEDRRGRTSLLPAFLRRGSVHGSDGADTAAAAAPKETPFLVGEQTGDSLLSPLSPESVAVNQSPPDVAVNPLALG